MGKTPLIKHGTKCGWVSDQGSAFVHRTMGIMQPGSQHTQP